MEDSGYNVQVVSSLNEAKFVISRHFFDIAIVDLKLDEFDPNNEDGLEVARCLDRLKEGTMTFVCTGCGTVQSARIAFRRFNVYDYIEKDFFDLDEFRQIIASPPSDVVAPNRSVDPLNLLVGISPRDLESALAGGTQSSQEATAQVADEASLEKMSKRISLTNLRQMLACRFNESELRDLCFDLKVDYDNLPGEGKSDKARELIAYLDRRNSISELVRMGQQIRPDISWSSTLEVTTRARRLLESLSRPYQPLVAHRQRASIDVVQYKHGRKVQSSNVVDMCFWSRALGQPIVMRLASASLPKSCKPQFISTPDANSSLQLDDLIGRVYVATEQGIPFTQFDFSLGRFEHPGATL